MQKKLGVHSQLVSAKGRGEPDEMRHASGFIRRLGHNGKLIFRCDNEPALQDLTRGIGELLQQTGDIDFTAVELVVNPLTPLGSTPGGQTLPMDSPQPASPPWGNAGGSAGTGIQ